MDEGKEYVIGGLEFKGVSVYGDGNGVSIYGDWNGVSVEEKSQWGIVGTSEMNFVSVEEEENMISVEREGISVGRGEGENGVSVEGK